MSSAGAPTLLAVRARRLAGRRRWRRAFVAVAVLVTALVVTAQFRAVEAARSRWADTRVVAVARHDLGPGDVIDSGSVELREVAAASVAPAALEELPAGSVVRHPVAEGEPLVAGRLAPDGLTGLAALVPEGERAVAVPVGPSGRPPLALGDRVDVLAVTAPTALLPYDPLPPPPDDPDAVDGDGAEGDGGEGDGSMGDPPERPAEALGPAAGVVPLVDRALVVDVSDEVVTVAVPSALAPAVAAAVTQGAVVLTLTGA